MESQPNRTKVTNTVSKSKAVLIAERDLQMLKLFLGLEDDIRHTYKDIGEMFTLSRAGVGKAVKRTTIKLVEAYLNGVQPGEISKNKHPKV